MSTKTVNSKMSELQILGVYSSAYPFMLLYGSPILPTVQIFEAASPEVWTEILLAYANIFSTMFVNIVRDKPLNKLPLINDPILDSHAKLLTNMIGNAGPEELPLLLGDIFGKRIIKKGGGNNDFSFYDFMMEETVQTGGNYNDYTDQQVNNAYSSLEDKYKSTSSTGAGGVSRADKIAALKKRNANSTLVTKASQQQAFSAENLKLALPRPAQSGLVSLLSQGFDNQLTLQQQTQLVQNLTTQQNLYGQVSILAQKSYCTALVGIGGKYNPTQVGEYIAKISNALNSDRKKLAEHFREGKKDLPEGISSETRAVYSILVDIIDKGEEEMGLLKTKRNMKAKVEDLKWEFKKRMIYIAGTAVIGGAIYYYRTHMKDDDPTVQENINNATAINNVMNATAPSILISEEAQAQASIFNTAGEWVGWGISGITGSIGSFAKGVWSQQTNKPITDVLGNVGSTLLTTAKTIASPITDPITSLWNMGASAINLGIVAAYTVGAQQVFYVPSKLWSDYTEVKTKLERVEKEVDILLANIRAKAISQSMLGYLQKKQDALSTIANFFSGNLTELQIRQLESMGGVEELVKKWEITFSSELGKTQYGELLRFFGKDNQYDIVKRLDEEIKSTSKEFTEALSSYKTHITSGLGLRLSYLENLQTTALTAIGLGSGAATTMATTLAHGAMNLYSATNTVRAVYNGDTNAARLYAQPFGPELTERFVQYAGTQQATYNTVLPDRPPLPISSRVVAQLGEIKGTPASLANAVSATAITQSSVGTSITNSLAATTTTNSKTSSTQAPSGIGGGKYRPRSSKPSKKKHLHSKKYKKKSKSITRRK